MIGILWREKSENRTGMNIGCGKGRIESLTKGIIASTMTLLVRIEE